MDWINQNKFKGVLIGVLLVLNVLTLGTIWMQMAGTAANRTPQDAERALEPVRDMKDALKFTESQTVYYDTLRALQRTETKQYNDRIVELKTQLAADVFADKPDTIAAAAKAKEIGELQSKVELARYTQFRSLVAICTPEQKEQLKPILTQLFGRKPPREEMLGKKQVEEKIGRGGQGERREGSGKEQDAAQSQARRTGQAAPPSVEEKLTKYTARLALTDEQVKKIRAVLQSSREKGEQLRAVRDPDRGEIEASKEQLKREEDDRIMKILDAGQKLEFEKMIAHRRR